MLSTLNVTTAIDESNDNDISDEVTDAASSFNNVLDLFKATQDIYV